MVKLPDLKRCAKCKKLYEDLFNGEVCGVCYVLACTEIIEIDAAQTLRERRRIARTQGEK